MKQFMLFFLGGFAVALGGGWLIFPSVVYRTQAQPVSFSHEVHTGELVGMDCGSCHGFGQDGEFAGIPKLGTCAPCHMAPMGETEAERIFVETYVTQGREPEWLVYSQQPDNAWFPHATHVTLAGLACEQCHGDHGATGEPRPYAANRISGYSRDVMDGAPAAEGGQGNGGMRMDDCIRCHQEQGLEHSCLDCHR